MVHDSTFHLLSTSGWSDYELLDTGNQQRLERFGNFKIARPDPQILWKPHLPEKTWNEADAVFIKTGENKGEWKKPACRQAGNKKIPEKWVMRYGDLKFYAKLTPFKHTGVFPEQAAHWDFIKSALAQSKKQVNVLNLFGYTGISTLVAAAAGAKVTHVDASYPSIGWARENQTLAGLTDKPIRWIEDDVLKFIRREIRRGSKYDGILMDPPVYGRGPKGETWIFNESFPELMEECVKLLSPDPLFVIVNAYAVSASALMLKNVLADHLNPLGGNLICGELALTEKSANRLLSTGIFGRWTKNSA